jgi:hypothetical protein
MATTNCKDCGNKVSARAKACPKCGAPVRANIGGRRLLLLVATIIAAYFSFKTNPSPNTSAPAPPTSSPPTPPSDGKNTAEAADLKRKFNDSISEGVFYSFEENDEVIRIAPSIWDSLPLAAKRDTIGALAMYYRDMGTPRTVYIKSSQNDEVFAEYGQWSGINIKR